MHAWFLEPCDTSSHFRSKRTLHSSWSGDNLAVICMLTRRSVCSLATPGGAFTEIVPSSDVLCRSAGTTVSIPLDRQLEIFTSHDARFSSEPAAPEPPPTNPVKNSHSPIQNAFRRVVVLKELPLRDLLRALTRSPMRFRSLSEPSPHLSHRFAHACPLYSLA